MRAMMGLIKDRHGTYCAQLKVPERLQAAVARVLGNGKPRQVYLKKSLGTKDLNAANVRAKPVLIGFDRVIRDATSLAKQSAAEPELRAKLNEAEISRMAEYVFAKTLAWDERWRVGGREELKRTEMQLRSAGEELRPLKYPYDTLPPHGWSRAQLDDDREQLVDDLRVMRDALALGDISAVEAQVADALATFGISLAPNSLSYPLLGIAIMRSYVRALQAIEQRNAGEPVETPKFTQAGLGAPTEGATLKDAALGWERHRVRPARTVHEYKRSVEMFTQMHGNLAVSQIRRSHVREFREALQDMPRKREGALLKATLPTLSVWGRLHPEAAKISPATINKQLGAVQAIVVWGNDNGLVPEDIAWSDPFSKMRVAEVDSERAPFDMAELQMIFDAPLFAGGKLPLGAKGASGVWLPLVALFTGARQAEIAGLTVADVVNPTDTGVPFLFITEQLKRSKRLKTKSSQRAIPIHEQLVKLGFLQYVEARKRTGEVAWLFPTVEPNQRRALAAWSKWFGRYLRATIRVVDTDKVFHSFRHSFKDAARAGGVSQEVHDALTGHANVSAVSGGYGAKQMLQRFGVSVLRDAIAKTAFPSLDLSKVQTGYKASSA